MNNEEIKKCISCGMCKSNCPIYKIFLTETASPKTKALIQKKGFQKLTKKELETIFINCTLCGACKNECPNSIDQKINLVRASLISHNIETEANKKTIENLKKYGNPFGK
jgi:fumarate reductase (CoM/CoB) subunit B